MNWYRKIVIAVDKEVEYLYEGILYTAEISGKYRPATYDEPAEYPEVDLIDAQIEDVSEIFNYIDWTADKFYPALKSKITNRQQYFGNINGHFVMEINGIKFVIRVPQLSLDNLEIINAEIVKSDEFLYNMPGQLKGKIKEMIYEKYINGNSSNG